MIKSSSEDLTEKEIDRLLHGDSLSPKDILEIWRKILEMAINFQDDIRRMRVSVEKIPKEIRELRMLFSRIERKGGFK